MAKKGGSKGKGKVVVRKIGRDARTGQFITVKEAQRRPKTTVVETIKAYQKPPKKK